MKAFHGEQTIKDEFIARIRTHCAADSLMQGHYWDGARGCAVGCTLEQADNFSGSIHTEYEPQLGIPAVVARLEDSVFENLHDEHDWRAWPEQFLTAIPVGADLSLVWPEFALWLLRGALASTNDVRAPVHDVSIQIVDRVGCLYARQIDGAMPSQMEWMHAVLIDDYRLADLPSVAISSVNAARAAARFSLYSSREEIYAVVGLAAAADAVRHACAAVAGAAYYIADTLHPTSDATHSHSATAAKERAEQAAESAGVTFWIDARDELLRLLREC